MTRTKKRKRKTSKGGRDIVLVAGFDMHKTYTLPCTLPLNTVNSVKVLQLQLHTLLGYARIPTVRTCFRKRKQQQNIVAIMTIITTLHQHHRHYRHDVH